MDDEDAELLRLRERQQARALLQGIPRRRAELAESEKLLVWNARNAGIGWGEIAAELKMDAGWQGVREVRGTRGGTGRRQAGRAVSPEPRVQCAAGGLRVEGSTLSMSQTTNGRDSSEKNKAPRSANTPPGPHGHNGCRAIDVTAYLN